MNSRRHRARLLWGAPLVVTLLLPLTGCWSTIQIEDLGLIVSTALDLVSEDEGKYKFSITNQIITSETTKAGKSGGSDSKKRTYNNVTETGDAILPTLRDMTLKSDKRFFAQHAKVIIIGEKLAGALNMQQTLDFFLREQEIRPSCLILIAQNRASSMLQSKEPTVIPAFHLLQISQGEERTTKILQPMTLAKLNGKLHSGSSFLLQNVVREDGEVKFSGAAVIRGKTKKLAGFMSETDLEGLTWLTGKGKGGLVRSIDEESQLPIVYEIKSMKSTIQPHVNGDRISFNVKIESDGRLAESWIVTGAPFDTELLIRAEKATLKEAKRRIKTVLGKMQKEYHADVAGFGNRLRIENPKAWKKVKKDWDEVFSSTSIQYDVKINISDYGTSGPAS